MESAPRRQNSCRARLGPGPGESGSLASRCFAIEGPPSRRHKLTAANRADEVDRRLRLYLARRSLDCLLATMLRRNARLHGTGLPLIRRHRLDRSVLTHLGLSMACEQLGARATAPELFRVGKRMTTDDSLIGCVGWSRVSPCLCHSANAPLAVAGARGGTMKANGIGRASFFT